MYFFLKQPKGDQETLIYLIYYISSKERNFKYSTGQKIHPDNWDLGSRYPKLKKGGAGKLNKHVRLVLDNYANHLDEIIKEHERNNKPLTKAILKQHFDLKFKKGVIAINDALNVHQGVWEFIKTKNKSKGQSKSWNQKYNNLMNKLWMFDLYRSKSTTFDKLSQDWLYEYIGFLRSIKEIENSPRYISACNEIKRNLQSQNEELKKIGVNFERKLRNTNSDYNDNTLSRHIDFLKTFLIWASTQSESIHSEMIKNDIDKFETDDFSLTLEEVEKLECYETDDQKLRAVADLFLIGIYSGQRFSDYSVFNKTDLRGDVIVKRSKKMKQLNAIPVHGKLKKILDSYDWELPKISNTEFNKLITEVCIRAGIKGKVKFTNFIGNREKEVIYNRYEKVKSHTARRTYISLATESGMPAPYIMMVTGIKNVDTLKKYQKTNLGSLREFTNRLFGYAKTKEQVEIAALKERIKELEEELEKYKK